MSGAPSARPGFAIVLPWQPHHTGGVNIVAKQLYQLLERRQQHAPVFVISSWEHKQPHAKINDQGQQLVELRIRSPLDTPSKWLRSALTFLVHAPGQIARIRQLLAQHTIRTINVHYVTDAALTWVLLKKLHLIDATVILSLHGTDLKFLSEGRGMVRRWRQWMLRNADAVVTVSEFMAKQVASAFPDAAQNVQVIHNGIDPCIVQSVETTTQTALSPTIVNLGSFDRVKGQDVLIRAFAALHATSPAAKLIIAGRPGPELPHIKQLIAEQHLDQAVSLQLDVSHAHALQLIAGASVVVISSRSEGLPLVALEAGLLGKAVIATRVGGIPEIIRHEQEGLLVESENAEALADALHRYMIQPALVQQTGAALQQRVKTHFTSDIFIEHYCRLAAH
jgi:L-malate glycosyltransferase